MPRPKNLVQETNRRTIAAGVVSGVAGGGLKAHSMANPEAVPEITEKYVSDPNGGGGSILVQDWHKVVPPVPGGEQILSDAVNFGVKAAAVGAGAMLAYQGYKALKNRKNRNLGRQW